MAPIKTRKTQSSVNGAKVNHQIKRAYRGIYYALVLLLVVNILPMMELPNGAQLMRPQVATSIHLTASAFSVGRFGWPGLEWREIIDWWTSGYSRGVVIGRNYIPPCKLCDMPRMFRVDK